MQKRWRGRDDGVLDGYVPNIRSRHERWIGDKMVYMGGLNGHITCVYH